MKKIIIFITITLCTCLSCNAQSVYTKIEQFNKFNELVSVEKVKTLIVENDSLISIEIQGHKPLYYDVVYSKWIGTIEKPTNLAFDIWGHEAQYFTMDEKVIVIRTITTKNGDYVDKVAWLELSNGDRLIFSLN